MRPIIYYTVAVVVNLIAFTVGMVFLPQEAPIHLNSALTADYVASPWWMTAFPAAAVLTAAGIWARLAPQLTERRRKILAGACTVSGMLLIYLGWIFFAIASSGAKLGETAAFPVGVVVVFPLAVGMMALGYFMPDIRRNRRIGFRTPATLKSASVWTQTHRLCGDLMFAFGVISAAAAVAFTCLGMDYIALIVPAAAFAIWIAVGCIYAHIRFRREKEAVFEEK